MNNMTNCIIKDLEELRGAQVSIFGQPTTLPESCDRFTIDTVEVFKSLAEYEVTSWNDAEYDDDGECIGVRDLLEDCADGDEALDVLIEYGFCASESESCDNTYNWSAPISNHLDFSVYRDKWTGGRAVFVEIKAHRFGDVRGNYTDCALYQFDSVEAFYEVLLESNMYESLEVDGVTYNFTIEVLSDCFEVYDADGEYICEAYGYDADEIAECIRERIA